MVSENNFLAANWLGQLGQLANNIIANLAASFLLSGAVASLVNWTTMFTKISALLIGIVIFFGWWSLFFGRHALKYVKRPDDYVEIIARSDGLKVHEQDGITKASLYLLLVNMSPVGFQIEPMTIDISGVLQSTSEAGIHVGGSSISTVGFVATLNEDQKQWFSVRRGQDVSINSTIRFKVWPRSFHKGITLESVRARIE